MLRISILISFFCVKYVLMIIMYLKSEKNVNRFLANQTNWKAVNLYIEQVFLFLYFLNSTVFITNI